MMTLQALLPRIEELGAREAVLRTTGYRTQRWSYRELGRHIQGLVDHFEERKLARGDRVLLWGENRPEWLAVYWAAVARGVTVVPMDFRSSATLVDKVQREVGAKLLVHGSSVEPSGLELPRLSLQQVETITSDDPIRITEVDPSHIAQIIYTSGTTGEPKGVVHRHRNLVANLGPIQKEIQKYDRYMRPFQPIRILDLLPSSHVFGQFTGLFVPVLLGGSVAFMNEVHPAAILDTIRRERVSILSTVPRFLSQLRGELERRFELDETLPPMDGGLWGGLRRWWHHRDVHSTFGWKFWAILSGGARLPLDDEDFWWRLGFVIVQGYGMTETSSLVTTNHPFHPRRGSLGKAVGNQQISLAEDGEILVRGDNVSLEYFGQALPPEDGWLPTGDVGEIGEDGVLYYKGRKKDVIVTADGMNVYPTDVEAALKRQPGVKDAVVLGRPGERGDVVHAVLLMDDGDADEAIQKANRELEPHQRVRESTLWPEEDFPRTASTFKVRRHEVMARLGAPPAEPPRGSGVRAVLAKHLGRSSEDLGGDERLSEELGLTSLDRVELLTELEHELGRELSEADMARLETVGELETWSSEAPPRASAAEPTPLDGLPRYGRIAPFRAVRTVFREAVIRPLFRHYLPLTVEGTVDEVRPPVIFAANHQSNLDTLAILTALPYRWRSRVSPAVQQEYFDAYLAGTGSWMEKISAGVQYWLAIVLVNVFPLSRSGATTRLSLRFAGALVDDGYSILIFPEGRLTRDGEIETFRPGVGLLAVELRIPVVPVHLDGLFAVMSYRDRWPTTAPVRVRFGPPLYFDEEEDYERATKRIEDAVIALGRRSG